MDRAFYFWQDQCSGDGHELSWREEKAMPIAVVWGGLVLLAIGLAALAGLTALVSIAIELVEPFVGR
jgi:hypothetical protein